MLMQHARQTKHACSSIEAEAWQDKYEQSIAGHSNHGYWTHHNQTESIA